MGTVSRQMWMDLMQVLLLVREEFRRRSENLPTFAAVCVYAIIPSDGRVDGGGGRRCCPPEETKLRETAIVTVHRQRTDRDRTTVDDAIFLRPGRRRKGTGKIGRNRKETGAKKNV